MALPAKPLTREQRIYLAIWRKAYDLSDSQPLVINCSTKAMAIKQRLGLYRAIRPFREGRIFDEGLRLASERLVLVMKGSDETPWTITFSPRQTLSELELQLHDLGLSESDLLTTEEKLANAAIEELVEKPSGQIDRRSTPFFTRD